MKYVIRFLTDGLYEKLTIHLRVVGINGIYIDILSSTYKYATSILVVFVWIFLIAYPRILSVCRKNFREHS